MHYPPYRIETKRTIIRCFELDDVLQFHDAILKNKDHLATHLAFAKNEPLPLEDRIEVLRKFRSDFDGSKDYTYGIFSKDDKTLLGCIGLHTRRGKYAFEIGYWIVQEECHKGIATEAVKALIYFAFQVNEIDRIEIYCNPSNEYSRKIPERLGFHCEGIRKRYNTTFPGEFRDSMIWVLFKHEYASMEKEENMIGFNALNQIITE